LQDTSGQFTLSHLFEDEQVKGPNDEIRSSDTQNPVLDHLRGVTGERPFRVYRTKFQGDPGHSAMSARLRDRSKWFTGTLPCLSHCCFMCEAEFPNLKSLISHIDYVHGGCRQYRSSVFAFCEVEPYVSSPTEKRSCIQRFSASQQLDTTSPETEPYAAAAPEDQGIGRGS
jgi:hypothetical protein